MRSRKQDFINIVRKVAPEKKHKQELFNFNPILGNKDKNRYRDREDIRIRYIVVGCVFLYLIVVSV